MRLRFNENPGETVDWHREEIWKHEDSARSWAGRYFGVSPGQVALTGSTTDGLAAIYGGLLVQPGKEILTSSHEHYSTYTTLEYRQKRMGTQVHTFPCSRIHTRSAPMKYSAASLRVSARRPGCWA